MAAGNKIRIKGKRQEARGNKIRKKGMNRKDVWPLIPSYFILDAD